MKIAFSKKLKKRSQALSMVAILVVAILLINLIVSAVQLRLDLTENKEFSLSPITKTTIKNLEDVVNIKAYFSGDLNARLQPIKSSVEDILSEYAAQSHGNILISFVDPKTTPGIEHELSTVGIPPIQFEIIDNDKYELANGYMGLGIFYGDKTEAIPVVQSLSTLEYDLTAAIKKVTREEIPVIGYITSNGTTGADTAFAPIYKDISQRFTVQNIDLSSATEITDEIGILILAGPTEQFTDWQLYLIDQFMMKGGSLVAFIENHTIGENLAAEPLSTGIEKLLKHYGLTLEEKIIGDASNSIASFRTQFGQFITQYPMWVQIPKAGMNPESAIVNRLEGVVLPWASYFTFEKDAFTSLINTTDQSWTKNITDSLDPTNQQPGTDAGTRSLAVQFSGSLTSYFKDKDIPAPPESAGEAFSISDKKTEGETARMYVVADNDFATEGFLLQHASNSVLALNIIDAAAQDEALLSIRARTIDNRPIEQLSSTKKSFIKWGNILIVPVILIVLGLLRSTLRKRRSKKASA